jgi:Fe-S cluster assembly scaffold protein SufB
LVPARVRATACKGERQVFEVRVGSRTIKATANHPFLVLEYRREPDRQRGRYRMTWKYLYQLKPGDLVAVAKRLPEVGRPYFLEMPEPLKRTRPIRLPQQTSPDLMWWLGVHVGDGFIHWENGGAKARVECAIPASAATLREEWSRVTHALFGVEAHNGDPWRMTVYSTQLARYLEANGFAGTAHTKQVPQWVFSLPQNQILAFLGGFVDADGYVRNDPRNHNVVLTSVNEPLLRDVQVLSWTCGLQTSGIYRFESRHPVDPERKIVGYRLQIAGDFERLGCRSPQRLDRMGRRKYHHDFSSAHNTTFRCHTNEFIGFAKVTSITPAGVEPVYDIEVEGPHNFVAEGLIVHNSEVVYHHIREDLAKKGVIFVDTDTAVREYPDLVRRYFGTVVPPEDNKFAALNSAVWSGGSFIYVPPGVRVDIPLQAYFRINAENVGQFERTLIIADEGAYVHYIEGCLPAGEQVSLGDRWVNVESLKPGDSVIAQDGRPARVRAVMVRPYRGELITIRPVSPYNAFRLTPEHPVWVVRRRDVLARRRPRNGWLPEVSTKKLRAAQPQYVPAGELEVGDFLVFPKVRPAGYNPKYSPQLLKLLGYYLAEGSAFKTLHTPVVSFSLGEHEQETIAEIVDLIHQVTGQRPYVVRLKGRHAVNIITHSQDLYEVCVTACGKGAASKQLSEELMGLPPTQIRPLLEAYFRRDGNVCDKGNSVMYRAATASEKLAQQLQELLAREGIFASIQIRPGGVDTIQGRRIRRKDRYIIVYTVDKRWSLVRETDDYFLVPIRAIERTPYEGFVFNLDVEGPNSYLVRGFAVHNCTAPIYSRDSLHSAVVEIIAHRGAHVRYTTIQNWSKNVYNLVTKRAVAYEDATVEWVDGNMGCLVGDTMVYKNNDVVPIRDIQVGDFVWSLTPDLRLVRSRVVAKEVYPPRPVYRLVLANRREVRATDNHPFLVLRKVGKVQVLRWMPLAEIRPGDQVAIVGQLPDAGRPYRLAFTPTVRGRKPVRFPELTDERLMWLFGFYTGDGYMDSSRVYFAVAPDDPAAEKVERLLKELFGVEVTRRGVTLRVNSVELVDFFRQMGFGGTAKTKQVPRWVFTLPQDQKRAFIEGYIAADGHVRKGHIQTSVTSANRELLEQIRHLAISCGMNPTKISTYVRRDRLPLGKGVKTYMTHFLYFSNESLSDAPVYFARVLTVQPDGEEITYDIEVEGPANFIANGIFAHNSKVTMKYPAVYLLGKGAKAEILSVAYAGAGQHQDSGGKVIHAAPYTTSTITSKSISKDGGRTTYRGLVKVPKGSVGVKVNVRCDALILDEKSRSDTYPYMEIEEERVTIAHEATVGKISDDQIFYLMSRGLTEAEALALIVLGFIEPFAKVLPMEYAIELNRLIQLEMEGAVG